MKRTLAVLIGGILLFGTTQSAAAQEKKAFVYLGGGATFPSSDYGTYAKTGWMAQAGLGYNLSPKVFIGLGGMYGSNDHSDVVGDKTDLIGGEASLGYSFGAESAKVRPYLTGEIGFLSHKYVTASGVGNESDTAFLVGGGGGLFFSLGKVGLYLEGRFLSREGTAFIPVMAGLSIPL